MTNKEIINLSVETKNGHFLGRVVEFEIDALTGQIVNYYVKSKNIIGGLFKNELVINQSQVISLTKEKMVVEDGAIEAGLKAGIKLSPEAI